MVKTRNALTKLLNEVLSKIDYSTDIRDTKKYFEEKEKYSYVDHYIDNKNKTQIIIGYKEDSFFLLIQIVDIILDFQEGFTSNYSEKFLEKKVMGLIRTVLLDPKKDKKDIVVKKVNELILELRREPIDFQFITKIFNIDLKDKVLDLGDVKLYGKNYNLALLKNEIKDILSLEKFVKDPPKVGHPIYCIAKAKIRAVDKEKVQEEGISKISEALNLISFLSFRKGFLIEGSAKPSYRSSFICNSKTGRVSEIHTRLDIEYILRPLQITKIASSPSKTIKELLKLYRKGEQRGSMENKIVLAVSWMGQAVRQNDVYNQLILLIVSLETLLLGEEYSGKGEALAERLAILNSELYENRTYIYNKIKKGYKLRNQVMHLGLKPHIKSSLIEFLMGVINATVLLLCSKYNFKTIKELKNYVTDKKLGKYKTSEPAGRASDHQVI